jgi:predicted Rossmann fold flavoprotein
VPWDVVVVGAGAAGLVAAERAATRGRRTLLLEKNNKPGIKILMSGGTRCNLTHAVDRRAIVEAFGPPGRFLHSALAALSPSDLVELVEGEGVLTKVEATGKIFPVSDKATDVLRAFTNRLGRSGATLALAEPLVELERTADGFRLITSSRVLEARTVVITVGGQSYPGCGTTGDGYAWAARMGHTLVPSRPALVPVTTSAGWIQPLQGVTIPDVAVRVLAPTPEAANDEGQPAAARKSICLDSRRGSFLLTHFGLSGPVVLDVSRAVTGHSRPQSLLLECDFLPAIAAPILEERLRAAAAAAGKKQLLAILPEELPRRLTETLMLRAGLAPESKAAEVSKVARAKLVHAIKATAIPVHGTRGFKKAEVTAGGVTLDEVDSRTMQSKLVPGLYWAGEVLDLDGPIGGYNFQAAFSTGWLAGESV